MKRTIVAVGLLIAAVLTLGASRWQQAGSQVDHQRLADDFTAALEDGRHGRAIELGLQLVTAAPQNPTYAYNLACAYAKAGNGDAAVHWLSTSAERGFKFLATMQRDEDLASLRQHPGYAQALAAVKANSDRDLEAFKKEVADVEPIVILPPNHRVEIAAPLIVALHPTGGNARDFVEVWRQPAADFGAILVVPQGRMQAGTGWRWGKVEHGEWQALHAIDYAKTKHAIDGNRVILTGFSEGGSVTFVVALRHPQAISAAIPMCGEFVPQVSPVTKTKDGIRTPRMYIITGEYDRDVATNRSAVKQLEDADWTVHLREFAGMGHSLPPNARKQFEAALKWAFAEVSSRDAGR
jgi:predicted esterase